MRWRSLNFTAMPQPFSTRPNKRFRLRNLSGLISGGNGSVLDRAVSFSVAFSSEVDTGSREEKRVETKTQNPVLIQSEPGCGAARAGCLLIESVCQRVRFTSPACGGGRRAKRGGWGKSIPSTSAFCGRTPTPTLPRKRPQAGEGAGFRRRHKLDLISSCSRFLSAASRRQCGPPAGSRATRSSALDCRRRRW